MKQFVLPQLCGAISCIIQSLKSLFLPKSNSGVFLHKKRHEVITNLSIEQRKTLWRHLMLLLFLCVVIIVMERKKGVANLTFGTEAQARKL